MPFILKVESAVKKCPLERLVLNISNNKIESICKEKGIIIINLIVMDSYSGKSLLTDYPVGM